MFNARSACPTTPVAAVVPTTYIVQRQPDPVLESAMLAASGGQLKDLQYAIDLLRQRRAERTAHKQAADDQRESLAYLNRCGSL